MTPFRITPDRTALVLVDLMPRIVALETAPLSGPEVLRRCVRLAADLRAAGSLVVFVRTERRGVGEQPPGSELAPECVPLPDDVQLVKHTIGAFHQTGLDELLRGRGIDTVVLGGLTTNFGVESTGRAADDHDYAVVYVSDAMTGLHEHAHQFAVDYVFARLGVVCSTEGLLRGLRGGHA